MKPDHQTPILGVLFIGHSTSHDFRFSLSPDERVLELLADAELIPL